MFMELGLDLALMFTGSFNLPQRPADKPEPKVSCETCAALDPIPPGCFFDGEGITCHAKDGSGKF